MRSLKYVIAAVALGFTLAACNREQPVAAHPESPAQTADQNFNPLAPDANDANRETPADCRPESEGGHPILNKGIAGQEHLDPRCVVPKAQ